MKFSKPNRVTLVSMLLCYSIVGYLFYDSCIKGVEYDDGTYCADVYYYNPSTETQSHYNLTVHVEDNTVIQLDFNNGGWLDDSHFNPPSFNRNGIAIVTDDRDYQYIIKSLKKGECEH